MTSSGFIEIINQNSQKEHDSSEWIDCYVATNIDCKVCEPLTRELNNWQREFTSRYGNASSSSSSSSLVGDTSTCFPKIDHLKRIRRRPATTDEIEVRIKSKQVIHEDEATAGGNGMIVIETSESTTTATTQSREQHTTIPAKKKNNKKRNKPEDSSAVTVATAPWSLDLLIGSIAAIDYSIQKSPDDLSIRLHSILERYHIHPQSSMMNNNAVSRRKLPGRPAKTKEEHHEWNVSLWPTLFFEEQTLLYKEEQLALTSEEIDMMRMGIKEAIDDAMVGREQWNEWIASSNNCAKNETTHREEMAKIVGAVVMNPQTCFIVSRASEERRLQGMTENGNKLSYPMGDDAQRSTTTMTTTTTAITSTNNLSKSWSTFPEEANPMLCTPLLLALQGVSRKERTAAMGCGMDSMEFQGGQYLCTGYDVYLTKEPNVYEAMALVHSRVRRVVFGVQDREMGGLGGATTAGIHSLPGTNHHYRAFRFDMLASGDGHEEIVVLKQSLNQLHLEDTLSTTTTF